MGTLDWVALGNGKARFVGQHIGADEEPHHVLAVELRNEGVYFGEFATAYESDENHFNIEIISFGYNSKNNIGNQHPGAKAEFNYSDSKAIHDIILELIFSPGEKPYPLKQQEWFRGGVSFRKNWIVTKSG
ncbi:hypothetical protein FJ420_33200 [Mesorhizobium sp. B3-1-3]|uniref:hypothetical protein n=1 Tax=unclassified Mesorhizobium TaxID=325217 RepID=UPI001126673D|nr:MULTISPECIES: hypothetical protein [unclassified Mesorhizobium]TPI51520.1 hypothetical protein FJ424_33230 [Mesorhizobium sp. B3-1-8]TPI58043.1 hypothetical protein FJ420_33200 [Mesorhizobium sp. B3-1-3]